MVVTPATIDIESTPPRVRKRRNAARNASIMAFLAGVLNLVSSAFPSQRERLEALALLVPGGELPAAFVVATATGVALILLSGGLRRRNQVAWAATVILLAGSVVAHVLKGLDIEEAAIEAFMVGYLIGQGDEFTARVDFREQVSFVRPALVVLIATFAYGFVGLSFSHRVAGGIGTYGKFKETVHMAIGLGSVHQLRPHFDRFFPGSVAAMFYCGLILVVLRVLAPTLHPRHAGPISEDEALQADDSLAWFATRDDRMVVRRGGGAIAYGVMGSVALAAGDPFGPRSTWPGVAHAFLEESRSQGRVAAVIGCGPLAAEVYRSTGLEVRYMGDEAILDLDDFTVEGGGMKVARQSWNRAKRAGYSATVVRSGALDDATRDRLKSISGRWRGEAAERGFSMALGRLFDARDEQSIFVIGWNEKDEPAGFLHLVPWKTDGASLDVMRRDRNGPAIFNDFLVVEAALQLPNIGVRRISLNFSFLRAVFEADTVHAPKRLIFQRWVLKRLSRSFQIESLYRFNKKFRPSWQARYFAIEALQDAPRVLLAGLRAEGLIGLPRLRKSETPPATSEEATGGE